MPSEYSAAVVVHGNSYEEAEMHAQVLEQERGLTWVNPFDDPMVIAGQGTIGLEILEDLPEVATVVSTSFRRADIRDGTGDQVDQRRDSNRRGYWMERAPVMYHRLKAGKPHRHGGGGYPRRMLWRATLV